MDMSDRTAREQRRKDLERIKQFCLLDDTFMKVVLKDNIEGVQDIVRTLLKQSDIDVIEVRVQDEWTNLVGHSVRLDVTAKDAAGKRYDIEVQRAPGGASAKRARYNAGALDWHLLPAGDDYDSLPEVYIIFITETDVLAGGLPVYTIGRFIEETGERFDDSLHILYANASYRGDDPIGRLMADFRERDPQKMHHRSLARPAGFYKNTEGGIDSMCSIMDELRAEGIEIGVQRGRTEGIEIGVQRGSTAAREKMILALLRNNTEDALLHGEPFSGLEITRQEIDDAKRSLRS